MSNKALLVGVNKYNLPGSDLQGCVNDVTNVRDVLLKHFGFTVRNIRVLVDTRATKKAILERLAWLVKGVVSGTREAMGLGQLPPEQTIKPRFLAPPVDIRMREEDDLKVQPIARSANPQSHALFSGCRDNQTSADAFIGGAYNGAFTYYFCKHLRSAQGNITRADLLKNLRASLRHEGYSQVPQLECPTPACKKKLLE